ncbi:hypothetical protein GCM10027321_36400 [Massilia terrae]
MNTRAGPNHVVEELGAREIMLDAQRETRISSAWQIAQSVGDNASPCGVAGIEDRIVAHLAMLDVRIHGENNDADIRRIDHFIVSN